MPIMRRSSTRLSLIAVMLVSSAIYGVVVTQSPQTASAIALGYVAVLLTIFVLVEVWRHHDR